MSKPTEVSYFESASIPAAAFFTVRSMSYSQQLHGEPTAPPWPEPRVPTATALVQSEAGYANAATSTHQPIPAPPASTLNPMWNSGHTFEEEDRVHWGLEGLVQRACGTCPQCVGAVTVGKSDDEYDVEWERMEYVRCNRLPVDYLDGWSNDALKRLDDSIRDNLETCRRMNAERRVLHMSKAPPPAAPQIKEPPPRCPTTYSTPGKAPPPSLCNGCCEDWLECQECVDDDCPLCGRYDRCPCDDDEVAVAMDERQMRRVERQNRAAAARRKLQSRGLVPKDKKKPMMPKPGQISRCLDRYRCLEPTALPKQMPTPEPNGRITLVEPGDLNDATDGVPWPVCSRCNVFRPFAHISDESCDALGVECTYEA